MAAPLNKHTMEQRRFIVMRLAEFYSPLEIAIDFAAKYSDTACTEADIQSNDPQPGRLIDPDLTMLFAETREAFLLESRELPPTAKKHVRLHLLHRMAMRYVNSGRYPDARSVFKQIADELNDGGETVGNLADVPTSFERVIVDPKESDAAPS